MTIAADETGAMAPAAVRRQREIAARRLTRANAGFRAATWCAAFLVLLIFAGMFIALAVGSVPALKEFGLGFFTATDWDPVTESFGILPQIYGTLLTSFIAMLIATPIGVGIAVFLTELCPRPLRRPIGLAVELLAGIPSIIYGIWGLFVFTPFFQMTAQSTIIDFFANVPVLNAVFGGAPFGIGVFTASVILAIMILPLIASLTRDVLDLVPTTLKDGAYAMGSTVSEVVSKVILPYARPGIVGAAMLALGRALGETMAVTFVIGNAHKISPSVFSPGTTISAAIANEFSEATTQIYQSALLASALFLMAVTFVVLALAELMMGGIAKRASGAGH